MDDAFLDPPGTKVAPDQFVVARAKDLRAAIEDGRLDFVELIECRQLADGSEDSTEDIIVIDVDVERPQVVENDIRRVERLAILFRSDDSWYPDVLSMRPDFPDVPHLNLRDEELPKSLCLYDQSWDEVKTRWTAPAFIERIRGWLADTAVGSLHREDQPLEQVLSGSGYRLVIPWVTIKVGDEAAERLDVVLYPASDHKGTLVAYPIDPDTRRMKQEFIATLFIANTRQHGIIRKAPRTLGDLCGFLEADGYDLLAEMRSRVKKWKDEGFLDASLILVVVFPLKRDGDGDIEVTDTWAFITMDSVFEVGRRIGVWEKFDGKVGCLLTPTESMRGMDVALDIVRPHFSFTRKAAAQASGADAILDRMVAVGAGAIGSQVVVNLVRCGFGSWTIVDEDELLPHNLARHALPPTFVGWPKANAVAALVNSYYEDGGECAAINANVLRPRERTEVLDAAFSQAQMILDFSASVPVSRHLSQDIQCDARRASLFLNPRGSDLVVLSESKTRSLPLDFLEAQYHRAVIRDPALSGHLAANESRTRYARTCRDVSFSIPTHLASIHSAIAAQAVRMLHASDDAVIRIWKADPVDCAVSVVEVPIVPAYSAKIGEWTVVMDRWLLDQLQQLRQQRLPNETGGVLLGMYDLPRKIVYVVDTIASPPDSEEKPTLYIRGCEGLADRVATINIESAGEVEYIGEWHSHPDRCSCRPSADDLKLFANITDRMTASGYPALMAIVGQEGYSAWYLGTISSDSGWMAP